MLPIVLTENGHSVGLAGAGEARECCRRALEAADFAPKPIPSLASPGDLKGLTALFIAGLPRQAATRLVRQAKAAGVLVNVEDEPGLCDFFMPAIIRRGDLLVSVSTSGRAPGLAKLVRQWIERRLGVEWAERLEEVDRRRLAWRRHGASPREVSSCTAKLVEERGWLG